MEEDESEDSFRDVVGMPKTNPDIAAVVERTGAVLAPVVLLTVVTVAEGWDKKLLSDKLGVKAGFVAGVWMGVREAGEAVAGDFESPPNWNGLESPPPSEKDGRLAKSEPLVVVTEVELAIEVEVTVLEVQLVEAEES